MKQHQHFPFFSQWLGGKLVSTCTCGAQRRTIGPNLRYWHLPHRARDTAAV